MSKDQKKPYWQPAGRDRWHSYYVPSNNLPGILLMILVAAAGILASGVALNHILQEKNLHHDDAVLGAIGLFLIVLGLYQAIKLAREPN